MESVQFCYPSLLKSREVERRSWQQSRRLKLSETDIQEELNQGQQDFVEDWDRNPEQVPFENWFQVFNSLESECVSHSQSGAALHVYVFSFWLRREEEIKKKKHNGSEL